MSDNHHNAASKGKLASSSSRYMTATATSTSRRTAANDRDRENAQAINTTRAKVPKSKSTLAVSAPATKSARLNASSSAKPLASTRANRTPIPPVTTASSRNLTASSSKPPDAEPRSLPKSTTSTTVRSGRDSKEPTTAPTASDREGLQPPPIQANPSSHDENNDSLQTAAQVYPWIYMTTSLEECFKRASNSAEKALREKEAQLKEEEASIADQRTRFEAENLYEFCEALSSSKISEDISSTMRLFLSHGKASSTHLQEALNLSTSSGGNITTPTHEPPSKRYNQLISSLESLLTDAESLQASLTSLSSAVSPEILASEFSSTHPLSRLQSVFSACLPIVLVRHRNVSLALELVRTCKQNLAMSLYIESRKIDSRM